MFAASTASSNSDSAPSSSVVASTLLPADRLEEMSLISGLAADDPTAWRSFDARYSRTVHRAITRVTTRFGSVVTSEDVREIYGNFCLSLLANDKSKLLSFDPTRGSSLASWLSLLAAHAAYDLLRRRRREPIQEETCDELPLPSDGPDPYQAYELRERAAIAATMIQDFSDRDREFLELYYGDGLEPEQIASRMGVSVKTVYSKKHKIQSRLEALLSRRRLAA
jgi:RNA polymerase sigma-70 factor, ECF subfamily